MSAPAPIGHNSPPLFDALSLAMDDARDTAADFLDGKPITDQGQADAVGRIVSEVKKLRKDAEDARKEEKRPHDDAAKAVQAKWLPLLDKADTIVTAAQRPLTDYLAKLAAEQARQAELAREEANRKQQAAIAAQRASEGSVEAVEAAKAMQKDADKAVKDAARAEKAKPQVAGMDRAIGLRSSRVATVRHYNLLLDWLIANDRPALEAFMDEYARKAMATLPGVEVSTERKAA